jgi:hypothetical protein
MDFPEEAAATLSLHYLEAGEFQPAWRYATAAEKRAEAVYAFVEAAGLYARGGRQINVGGKEIAVVLIARRCMAPGRVDCRRRRPERARQTGRQQVSQPTPSCCYRAGRARQVRTRQAVGGTGRATLQGLEVRSRSARA